MRRLEDERIMEREGCEGLPPLDSNWPSLGEGEEGREPLAPPVVTVAVEREVSACVPRHASEG